MFYCRIEEHLYGFLFVSREDYYPMARPICYVYALWEQLSWKFESPGKTCFE